MPNIHCVSEKKSTHIIGYKFRDSSLILIIFDIKIPHCSQFHPRVQILSAMQVTIFFVHYYSTMMKLQVLIMITHTMPIASFNTIRTGCMLLHCWLCYSKDVSKD